MAEIFYSPQSVLIPVFRLKYYTPFKLLYYARLSGYTELIRKIGIYAGNWFHAVFLQCNIPHQSISPSICRACMDMPFISMWRNMLAQMVLQRS